jgi:hypothetical protein
MPKVKKRNILHNAKSKRKEIFYTMPKVKDNLILCSAPNLISKKSSIPNKIELLE